MTGLNSIIKNKTKLLIFAFLFAFFLALAMQNAQAKVFTIQNESVNMLVVNGTTGNIILNPNAGFGNVRIRE